MNHLPTIALLTLLLSTNSVACTRAEQPIIESESSPATASSTLRLTISEQTMTATLYDNSTTRALKTIMPLTLSMSDFNNNEKVASLPKSLPTNATNLDRVDRGDIVLYGSNSIVVFYETFTTPYSYTRIGRVDDVSRLKTILGTADVSIKFEMI